MMSDPVTVIIPAFRAQSTIAKAVASALDQGAEVIVSSDDGVDYLDILSRAGTSDPCLRLVSTGGVATGSANARNLAIAAAETRFLAGLDADDYFLPGKLARALPRLREHPVVTVGLRVERPDGTVLRHVGCTGRTELLTAGYKQTNISMDSMLLWDRERIPTRYDTAVPRMIDLDFLMRAFAHTEGALHIGEPLHAYVKQPLSMSNAPGSSPIYAETKRQMIAALEGSGYPMRSPSTRNGILDFLRLSLKAEESFEAALARRPGLIFEDHVEPLLTGPGSVADSPRPFTR
jgi:glycosyltransferase involved in cell wall biosynthesis